MKKVNLKLIDYAPGASRDSAPSSSILTPTLLLILDQVRRELGRAETQTKLDITAAVRAAAIQYGIELSSIEQDQITATIEDEQRDFGILQSLVDDSAVSDIIVSAYNKVTIQQGRKNFAVAVQFPSQMVYETYVEKLLARAGASYSTKKPIADGMIGSLARIHAVHKSISDGGPYLTIRINRFSSVQLSDLADFGLAPSSVLKYLQAVVRAGKTVLVVGEVSCGKTTLVRALAGAMPQHESILVIEDTPEIRLDHPNTRYLTTREENIDGAGRVSPSSCIRGGMRMAMNRIIFGEMRDAEAAEAFIDVCASGHPGLSTIHARSAIEAITRLELFLGRAQRGVGRQVLAEQICTAVQVIVHLDICRETGKRRIFEVKEIGPIADGVIRQRDMFLYSAKSGGPVWKVANRLSAHRNELEHGTEPVILSSMPGELTLREGA